MQAGDEPGLCGCTYAVRTCPQSETARQGEPYAGVCIRGCVCEGAGEDMGKGKTSSVMASATSLCEVGRVCCANSQETACGLHAIIPRKRNVINLRTLSYAASSVSCAATFPARGEGNARCFFWLLTGKKCKRDIPHPSAPSRGTGASTFPASGEGIEAFFDLRGEQKGVFGK